MAQAIVTVCSLIAMCLVWSAASEIAGDWKNMDAWDCVIDIGFTGAIAVCIAAALADVWL